MWAGAYGTCQEGGVSHHQRWYSITRSDQFVTPIEVQLETEPVPDPAGAGGFRWRRIDGISIPNLMMKNDCL
jgi:hypothetical protein